MTSDDTSPDIAPEVLDSAAKPLFKLSERQVQWIMLIGFSSVGYALYLRYLAVEFSHVALACDTGLKTALCTARSVATTIFRNSGFGLTALICAVLHLMHPSIVLLTIGVAAAGMGIVLYNVALSGLAVGIMLLAFARPAPARD